MNTFLESTTADYYYRLIADIVRSSKSDANKIFFLRSALRTLMADLTKDEPQLFTDTYSRLVFMFDKSSAPDYVRTQLFVFHALARRVKNGEKADSVSVLSSLRALSSGIFHFSAIPIPSDFLALFADAPELRFGRKKIGIKPSISILRAIILELHAPELVQGNHKRGRIVCSHDEFGTITVDLWGDWARVAEIGWRFALVNLFELNQKSESEFSTSANSFVVLEPDFLVDATELAECFQNNGANPHLWLLKRFTKTESTEAMILGNVANAFFDEIIVEGAKPEASESAAWEWFETIFNGAIASQKPLGLLSLVRKNPKTIEIMREKAWSHFLNIRKAARRLHFDSGIVEPTFISELYGLQGRLDLLLEHGASDERRKEVIELKSGKPPSSGFWTNHLAQVSCYNLLLDSTFEHRSGSSSILYSADAQTPLRNAPNTPSEKQKVLGLRNELVSIERAHTERKFSALRRLNPKEFGSAPTFTTPKIQEFERIFTKLSTLERKYFYLFASFIAREHWSAMAGTDGNENDPGFSALWRRSLPEKEAAYSVLAYLRLLPDESDSVKLYLRFARTEQTLSVSNFRQGDIILLYPMEGENPLRRQILKASIKDISPTAITVSVRNKMTNWAAFSSFELWAIERDVLGKNYTALYESLFDFFKATPEKRNLLLGLAEPRFFEKSELFVPQYGELTDEQNERLSAAMRSRDYFLLQGPPGTGKTSKMLKSMAKFLFEHTEEDVFFLAFTNRAVDEMCDALLKISPDFPFIRLGSKDSTTHGKRVLSEVLAGKSPEEMEKVVSGTRIFVSTVASLLTHQEIFGIKPRFSTVILDEASQIVEPQIVGLLTQFKRFILIGDERQLPAVVTQTPSGLLTGDAELNSAGISDVRVSLFERLIRLCEKNGWTHSYGMISAQGRMHADIQEFPNREFYDGKLRTLSAWQNAVKHELSALNEMSENWQDFPEFGKEFRRAMQNSRVVFLPTKPEATPKVNEREAILAVRLTELIYKIFGEKFTKETVGIIAPFRAQIAAIYAKMPEHLRGLVSVDTVERYQGSERDIIILSFSANYSAQLDAIQSLSSDGVVDRKLNVALTRAKSRLIALGTEEILVGKPHFRKFIEFVKEKGGYAGDEKLG